MVSFMPFLRLASLLLTLALSLSAQDARGRIIGRVTDPTGSLVPGAEILATNLATGVVVRAAANDSGAYELPYLAPGAYRIQVTSAGFKSLERPSIDVRVGERLILDFSLELGQVSESMVVTAQQSLIETGSASLGQVVDTKRILEMPLPGGNALSLARLAPGVINLGSPNHPSLGPAVEVLSNISVNGLRGGNVEFTVDGTPSMWGTNAAYAPPTDMVAEFKVQTANYDASVGRAPGGNINVVLRSGTNNFHTALYHFHNNQVLTAMDLFQRQGLYNPLTGPVTDEKRAQWNPRNILNRFGANFGGPVLIPKLYDGRNKTFWVYGFEGLTRPGIERGNTFFTVPTLPQRQGDFSQLLTQGAVFQVYDPSTIRLEPNGRYSRQPFAGNLIPQSRLDRTALGLLSAWPDPNTSGDAQGRNNFQRLQRSWNEFRSHTAKVDHNFSERHRAFVRYNQTFQLFSSGQVFENDATGNDRFRYNYGLGVDDVYTFTPRLLLNTRFGFTRFVQSFAPFASDFDYAAAGFSQNLANLVDPAARNFPRIQVAGYQNLGTGSNSTATSDYGVLAADLSWSAGNHNLRFGGEFRVYRETNFNRTPMNPLMAFGVDWTRGPLDTSPTAPIGQGLASYMLGLPTGGSMNVNDSQAEQSKTSAFYIQDDWRLSRQLTLNIGIRYDYDSPVTERFNRSVRGFAFDTQNPIAATALPAYALSPLPELPASQFRVNGGLTFAGVGGEPRTLWRADRNNFAPRIGLAWTPFTRTVIRTGYGIYYVPLGADRLSVNQSGYSISNALVASQDNGLSFIASLSNPFPSGLVPPPGSSGGLSTDVGRSVSAFVPEPRNGYTQRFSFGLQQELPWLMLIDLGYVGNRATGLTVTRPYNPIPNQYLSTLPTRDQPTINLLNQQFNNPFFPLPGTDLAARTLPRSQLLRPFPHFSGVSLPEQIGYSWYHSLQTRIERRFRQGVTFQLNHTWSKMMEANGFLNGGDAFLEEVISDLDRTHRTTFSGIYELPFGPGKPFLASRRGVVKQLTAGWQLQAVWQRNSGAPLGFGNSILLDDIRAGMLPSSERTLDRWFNTAIFERNAANQLASNVRTLNTRFNGFRSAHQETWDISAMKKFQIGEKGELQLRGEFLNALNRSNLAAPNTAPTNAQFGRVTATNGFPRQIHLGLRLTF